MKKIAAVVVSIAFFLVASLLVSACWVGAASKNLDKEDVAVFTVLLPEGKKAGLLHVSSGKWLIPPQFDSIDQSEGFFGSGGLPLIMKLNDKWGLVDVSGRIVVAPKFDRLYAVGERLFYVVMSGKYGLINENGETVLPLDYEMIERFSEGLIVVKKNGKYGYADKSGTLVIPLQYDAAWKFSEGLAMVMVNAKRGYIDKQGRMVVEPQFDRDLSGFFSEGLAAVQLDKKWGYIDRIGNFVIQPQFMEADSFHDGVAVVSVPYRGTGLINKAGEFIIEPKYYEIHNYSGPIMVVESKDYGRTVAVAYADKFGRILTPWFENGVDFAEGRAMVEVNGKFGFIDDTGKLVIPPIYDSVGRAFHGGVVRAKLDGREGYIDKAGKWTTVEQAYPRHKLVREYGGLYRDEQGILADHYANHMLLGYKYLESRDYAKAKEEFSLALRINPGDAAANYGLNRAQ